MVVAPFPAHVEATHQLGEGSPIRVHVSGPSKSSVNRVACPSEANAHKKNRLQAASFNISVTD